MTTDTQAEDRRRRGRRLAHRRHGEGRRACSRRASRRCSSCITTDADLPSRRRSTPRCARATRVDLRPARLRRLHVDERPGDAAGDRAPRASRPTLERLHRGRSPSSAPTSPGSCRPTPRARATTSRSRCVGAVDRGRRGRGRPLGRAQQPLQGRDLRQRPELGPRARRDRHHAGAVRPVPRRRLDERRARLPRGAPRPAARRGRPHAARDARAHRAARRRGIRHRSSPTTSRTTTCTRTAPTRADERRRRDDADETRPTTRRRAAARRKAAGAHRVAALAEALPRRDRSS